jgi:hypothetical protein
VLPWIPLDSEEGVAALWEGFADFHDACLRDATLATETFVDEARGMHCPGHLDTTLTLFFQSQSAGHAAIELRCEGVSSFRFEATPDGCESILTASAFSQQGDVYRLGLSFSGAPVKGPPNGVIHIHRDAGEAPDIEIAARLFSWRPLPAALGPVVRHQRSGD